MKKNTKKEVYASFGINYVNGYIEAPVFGMIKPLLKPGNTKVGTTVWTWSTLPTNEMFHVNIGTDEKPEYIDIQGTCPCHCPGCYATTGRYNCGNVQKSMAINTVLAYQYLDFVKRAVMSQILADNIQDLRIDAAGDLFSDEFVEMWKEVKRMYKAMKTWTYTKREEYEDAFDDLENANIVKSLIPGIGLNYGTCEHVLRAYNELLARGEKVYICRCGIDKNQHCSNCEGCSKFKYVLFIEHSTDYKAEEDPLYDTLKTIIENQAKPE